jgi:hypothetical protein
MAKSMKLVLLLGAVTVVAGAVAGLLPVATATASGCGSVFFPSEVYYDAMVGGTTCPEGVAARAPFVWAPIVAGAVLALGAAVVLVVAGRRTG